MASGYRTIVKMFIAAVVLGGNCFACGLNTPAALAAPSLPAGGTAAVDGMIVDCVDRPADAGPGAAAAAVSPPFFRHAAPPPRSACPMNGGSAPELLGNDAARGVASTVFFLHAGIAADPLRPVPVSSGSGGARPDSDPAPGRSPASYLTGTTVKKE